MKILWATTFAADMWETTGRHMVESFLTTKTPGTLVAYTEGMDVPPGPRILNHRLEGNRFLADFLQANRAVIPKAIGGDLDEPECRCRKGPFDVHSKKHRLPCPGYWFCKNAFRWLRKVISAKMAADTYQEDHDIMIWVDSDGLFKQTISPEEVASWFPKGAGCIYLKSRRTEIETGIVGYHLRQGGLKVLDHLVGRYSSGKFRRDSRWDDCRQLGSAIKESGVKCVDLATKVGDNATVIQYSPLGAFLDHKKGAHRRSGTMT